MMCVCGVSVIYVCGVFACVMHMIGVRCVCGVYEGRV